MHRLLVSVLTIVSVLVTLTMVVLLLWPPAEEALPLPSPDDVASIIEQSRSLRAVTYRYRDIVSYETETRVFGIRTEAQSLLFAVEITVEAGVDLTEGLQVELSRENPEQVFVSLPAARVLTVDAREDSIDQYFSRERFGELDWLAVSDEIERAKGRNEADALERGILVDAERQTRIAVSDLLRSAGFTEVTIRFAPARELRG